MTKAKPKAINRARAVQFIIRTNEEEMAEIEEAAASVEPVALKKGPWALAVLLREARKLKRR